MPCPYPFRTVSYQAHPTSVIDEGAEIGAETRIWHFAHVCGGARIGERCSFGQNTMVAPGVVVGNNVKVQNNVAIYTGTTIEDDVFLGPSCVLTNVTNPRSQVSRKSLYEETRIRRGATVGANATIVCGVTLGRYAFVAAGAVVTRDVPDYGFVVGVPGKRRGWMSRHGHLLAFREPTEAERAEFPDWAEPGRLLAVCPESGFRYGQAPAGTGEADAEVVCCLDLDEEAPLPDHLAVGNEDYDTFKGRS